MALIDELRKQELMNSVPKRSTGFPAQAPTRSPYEGMAAPSMPSSFMPGTRAVYNESGKSIRNLVDQGRIGVAAGEAGRAALAYVPAVADDVIGGAVRAIGPGLAEAGRQFLGLEQQAAQPAAGHSLVSQARMQAPASPASMERPALPAQTTPGQQTEAPPAVTKQPMAGREVMPSVYENGRGNFSDSQTGASFPAGFTGQPSVQNDAAAASLAQRSAQRTGVPLIEAAGLRGQQNLTPQTSGSGYGLLDQGARNRRSALMDAQQVKPGARTALAALLRQQGEQPGLELARERMTAEQEGQAADRGLRGQLAQVEMANAERRMGMDATRTGIEQQRLDLEREGQGVKNRSLGLVQQMREQIASEQDPAKRQALVRRMRDVEGGQTADPYMAVQGGQEWDAAAGAMRNVPARVFNRQTGQFVDAGQPAAPALPPGMTRQVGTSGGKPVYEDAQGRRFVGD